MNANLSPAVAAQLKRESIIPYTREEQEEMDRKAAERAKEDEAFYAKNPGLRPATLCW